MNTLYLDGGIVGATYTRWAVRVGPGGQKGRGQSRHLHRRAAGGGTEIPAVKVNDPKAGTMQAMIIDGILKRPEFAARMLTPSTKGEGAAAGAR